MEKIERMFLHFCIGMIGSAIGSGIAYILTLGVINDDSFWSFSYVIFMMLITGAVTALIAAFKEDDNQKGKK